MKTTKSSTKFTTRALQHYTWLAAFYIALIFFLPANNATRQIYHFSAIEYHVVSFIVALPMLAVWLAAFVGYAQLRAYAASIRKTPEGIYFDQLAEGVTWLAWSLPVSVIVPYVLNSVANSHPGFHAGARIISDYIVLILPLIAFSVVAAASRGLLATVRIKLTLVNARLIIIGFLLLGVLYCFFTFRHFDLTSLGSSHNPYYLPIWLMVMTITIPYLYAWFMGILAAFELTLFRRHVRGVLYRQPLGLVVGGLLTVILSSVALQYIAGVAPGVGHLLLNFRLMFILLFRVIGGGGFVLIALGANRLRKIEEV